MGKKLLLTVSMLMAAMACKKDKKDEPGATQLSAFAQSLKQTCNAPFKGKGDGMDVYLPTAMSPNGDGINDVYGLAPIDFSFLTLSMDIYDTLGKLVFHTTTPSGNMWDGQDMNTGKLAQGYKYYVKLAYKTAGGVADSGGSYVFLLPYDAVNRCTKRIAADMDKYIFASQFVVGSGFDRSIDPFEQFCK